MNRIVNITAQNLTLALPEILTTIMVQPKTVHGIRTYSVLVNGKEIAQFMSEGQANAKAIQYAQHLAKVS